MRRCLLLIVCVLGVTGRDSSETSSEEGNRKVCKNSCNTIDIRRCNNDYDENVDVPDNGCYKPEIAYKAHPRGRGCKMAEIVCKTRDNVKVQLRHYDKEDKAFYALNEFSESSVLMRAFCNGKQYMLRNKEQVGSVYCWSQSEDSTGNSGKEDQNNGNFDKIEATTNPDTEATDSGESKETTATADSDAVTDATASGEAEETTSTDASEVETTVAASGETEETASTDASEVETTAAASGETEETASTDASEVETTAAASGETEQTAPAAVSDVETRATESGETASTAVPDTDTEITES